MFGVKQAFVCFSLQNISVVEQEKIDKLMLEMDGTENKCEWASVAVRPGRAKLSSQDSGLP